MVVYTRVTVKRENLGCHLGLDHAISARAPHRSNSTFPAIEKRTESGATVGCHILNTRNNSRLLLGSMAL